MDAIDVALRNQEVYSNAALSACKLRQGDEAPLWIDGRQCCLDCRKPIPEKRLAVKPDAVRCVACQEIEEGK